MKYTENYKFKMPDGNDYVSVDDINDNFDAVDKELAQQKSDFNEYKGKTDVLESRPVNNNILINSNFANPVNQRGYVSGTDFMDKYTLDRWRGTGNLLIVENSYITLAPLTGTTANTFIQLLEKPEQYSGKVTLSLKCRTSTPEVQIQLFADGVANGGYSSLGYYSKHLSKANEWEVITHTFDINKKYTELKFGTNASNTFDVEWIKLELGDHATPYVPRLYAEELALCQRYYREKRTADAVVYGIEANRILLMLDVPNMRTTPTPTFANTAICKNNVNVEGFTFSQGSYFRNASGIIATKNNHGLSFSDCITGGGAIFYDAEL